MGKRAVEALGEKTTNMAIRNWIHKKYPGAIPATI